MPALKDGTRAALQPEINRNARIYRRWFARFPGYLRFTKTADWTSHRTFYLHVETPGL